MFAEYSDLIIVHHCAESRQSSDTIRILVQFGSVHATLPEKSPPLLTYLQGQFLTEKKSLAKPREGKIYRPDVVTHHPIYLYPRIENPKLGPLFSLN